MVRAGFLDKRITLRSPSTSQSGTGAVTETFSDSVSIWASIRPKTGKEQVESEKLAARLTHVIKIRFRTGLTTQWRVKYMDTATSPATTRTFGILAITNPLEGRRELLLLCEEKPDGGPV